jgi:hypothetical protein
MRRARMIIALALAALATPTPAAATSGTAKRVYVSALKGADAAACGSASAPCLTFQYAHDQRVAPGGEIDVLDPGGYGALTITKSVSIVNDGAGVAGIFQTNVSGSAITVKAGPSDYVNIKGLTLDGGGFGEYGIHATGFGLLTISNMSIRRFSDGIHVQPGGTSTLGLRDVVTSANAANGIYIFSNFVIRIDLRNVDSSYNTNGIFLGTAGTVQTATAFVNGPIHDSSFTNNTKGIYQQNNVDTTLSNVTSLFNTASDMYCDTPFASASFLNTFSNNAMLNLSGMSPAPVTLR